jgi:hypothetical protein
MATYNYSRRIYWTLNLVLLLLIPILAFLGLGELRQVKAEREDKARVQFCEDWEAEGNIPLDMCR